MRFIGMMRTYARSDDSHVRITFVIMIDPDNGVPVYRQLADVLRQRILRGDLPPGARLRTEPEYVDEFGLGRASVRRAMSILRSEGLIVTTRQGSRVRTVRDMAEVAIGADTRITTRMPTDTERRELGVPEGVPVFVVELQDGGRRLLAGDRTVLVSKPGRTTSGDSGLSAPEG